MASTIIPVGVPVYVGGTVPRFDGVRDESMVDGDFFPEPQKQETSSEIKPVYKGGTIPKRVKEDEQITDGYGRELFR